MSHLHVLIVRSWNKLAALNIIRCRASPQNAPWRRASPGLKAFKCAPSINQSRHRLHDRAIMVTDDETCHAPSAVQSMGLMKGTTPPNPVVSFFVRHRRTNSRRDVRPQPWEGEQDRSRYVQTTLPSPEKAGVQYSKARGDNLHRRSEESQETSTQLYVCMYVCIVITYTSSRV